MEIEVKAQECRQPPEAEKGKEVVSLLPPPKEMPANIFILA